MESFGSIVTFAWSILNMPITVFGYTIRLSVIFFVSSILSLVGLLIGKLGD